MLGVTLAPAAALAQCAQENPAASASDAFARSVGNESVGLYASGEVRGFSAADAGNARIEGLYFSRAGKITELLQAGSSIRVGITPFGQSFPAPTGIIDTDLCRVTSPRPVITARASSGDSGSGLPDPSMTLRPIMLARPSDPPDKSPSSIRRRAIPKANVTQN